VDSTERLAANLRYIGLLVADLSFDYTRFCAPLTLVKVVQTARALKSNGDKSCEAFSCLLM
jgi:hypothetical protein